MTANLLTLTCERGVSDRTRKGGSKRLAAAQTFWTPRVRDLLTGVSRCECEQVCVTQSSQAAGVSSLPAAEGPTSVKRKRLTLSRSNRRSPVGSLQPMSSGLCSRPLRSVHPSTYRRTVSGLRPSRSAARPTLIPGLLSFRGTAAHPLASSQPPEKVETRSPVLRSQRSQRSYRCVTLSVMSLPGASATRNAPPFQSGRSTVPVRPFRTAGTVPSWNAAAVPDRCPPVPVRSGPDRIANDLHVGVERWNAQTFTCSTLVPFRSGPVRNACPEALGTGWNATLERARTGRSTLCRSGPERSGTPRVARLERLGVAAVPGGPERSAATPIRPGMTWSQK